MNVPNLPTDNLYKLIAIGGLVIGVVGIVLPASYILANRQETIRLDIATRRLALEEQYLAFEGKRLQNEMQELLKRKNEPPREEIDRVKKEADLQFAVAKKKQLEAVENALAVKHNQDYMGFLNYILAVGEWMKWGGFGLFGLGLLFWYFKVQRHQDATLRLEAQLKREEIRTKAGA